MSDEKPDLMGDRLNRVLADLDELQAQLREANNTGGDFLSGVQHAGLGPAYTHHLVSLVTKILKQQHEIMVLLEYESGRGSNDKQ